MQKTNPSVISSISLMRNINWVSAHNKWLSEKHWSNQDTMYFFRMRPKTNQNILIQPESFRAENKHGQCSTARYLLYKENKLAGSLEAHIYLNKFRHAFLCWHTETEDCSPMSFAIYSISNIYSLDWVRTFPTLPAEESDNRKKILTFKRGNRNQLIPEELTVSDIQILDWKKNNKHNSSRQEAEYLRRWSETKIAYMNKY